LEFRKFQDIRRLALTGHGVRIPLPAISWPQEIQPPLSAQIGPAPTVRSKGRGRSHRRRGMERSGY
jgi:hypothetical protein